MSPARDVCGTTDLAQVRETTRRVTQGHARHGACQVSASWAHEDFACRDCGGRVLGFTYPTAKSWARATRSHRCETCQTGASRVAWHTHSVPDIADVPMPVHTFPLPDSRGPRDVPRPWMRDLVAHRVPCGDPLTSRPALAWSGARCAACGDRIDDASGECWTCHGDGDEPPPVVSPPPADDDTIYTYERKLVLADHVSKRLSDPTMRRWLETYNDLP